MRTPTGYGFAAEAPKPNLPRHPPRSAGRAARQDRQILVEPIPRLGGALLHPRLEQRIALLDRVELGGARERGLAVVLLEHVGLGPRLTRHALAPYTTQQ